MEVPHFPVPADPATHPPVGPLVLGLPRPRPPASVHRGRWVQLEPLTSAHAPELFRAASVPTSDAGWDYLSYGPFPSEASLAAFLTEFAGKEDPLTFAVRPHGTGAVAGWLALMQIEPAHGHIELGHIWLAPALRRTRAATEALLLPMAHAIDGLGYRRLTWKCNALNDRSRSAALRLGFVFEGILRNDRVVKGRSRSTAWFSILAEEWPRCRKAIESWLADDNWDHEDRPRRSLADLRARL